MLSLVLTTLECMTSAQIFYQTIICAVPFTSGLPWMTIVDRQRTFQASAMAPSTRRSRASQINCYLQFCHSYGLHRFPCPASQAGFYATFLSEFMSPASINNYLSAVWSHQRSLGYPSYPDDYALKLTLRGIRRLGKSSRPSRHPLSAQELLLLYQELNTLIPGDLVFWCALTLAFRALLRKCHYNPSPHTLRWRDVSIYPDHLVLVLPSSKTDQFSDHPHKVVLNSSPGSALCPVFWLAELARVQNPLESDYIFRLPAPGGYYPLTYIFFNSKLKAGMLALTLRRWAATHSATGGPPTCRPLEQAPGPLLPFITISTIRWTPWDRRTCLSLQVYLDMPCPLTPPYVVGHLGLFFWVSLVRQLPLDYINWPIS